MDVKNEMNRGMRNLERRLKVKMCHSKLKGFCIAHEDTLRHVFGRSYSSTITVDASLAFLHLVYGTDNFVLGPAGSSYGGQYCNSARKSMISVEGSPLAACRRK